MCLYLAYGYAENKERVNYIYRQLYGAETSDAIKAELVIAFANILDLSKAREILISLIPGIIQKKGKDFAIIFEAVCSVANCMSELGHLEESLGFLEKVLINSQISNSDLEMINIDIISIKLQFYVNSMKCMVPFTVFSERFHNSATFKSLCSGSIERMYENENLISLLKNGWKKLEIESERSPSLLVSEGVSNQRNRFEQYKLLMQCNALGLLVFPQDFDIDDVNKYFNILRRYMKLNQADYIFLLWTCALYPNYKSRVRNTWKNSLLGNALSTLKTGTISNKLFLPAMICTLPIGYLSKNSKYSILSSDREVSRAFIVSTQKSMFRPKLPFNKALLEVSKLTSKHRIRWSRQMHFVFLWSASLSNSFDIFKSQYQRLSNVVNEFIFKRYSVLDTPAEDLVTRFKDNKYYLQLFTMCANDFRFSKFAIDIIYKELKDGINNTKVSPGFEKRSYLTVPVIVSILNCCASAIRRSYLAVGESVNDEKGLSQPEIYTDESLRVYRQEVFKVVLELVNESSLLGLINDWNIEKGVIRCCFAFQDVGNNKAGSEYEIIKEGELMLSKYIEKNANSEIEIESEISIPTFKMILSFYSQNLEQLVKVLRVYLESKEVYSVSEKFLSLVSGLVSKEIVNKTSSSKVTSKAEFSKVLDLSYFEIEILFYLSSAFLQEFLLGRSEKPLGNLKNFIEIHSVAIEALLKKSSIYHKLSVWETESTTISRKLINLFFGTYNPSNTSDKTELCGKYLSESLEKLDNGTISKSGYEFKILDHLLNIMDKFLSTIKSTSEYPNQDFIKLPPSFEDKNHPIVQANCPEDSLATSDQIFANILLRGESNVSKKFLNLKLLELTPEWSKQLIVFKESISSSDGSLSNSAVIEHIKDKNYSYLSSYLQL
ncbi:hypothetical protein AYI70_g3324 [Smittium culicis]|uniref:Uncharacterized protein n=1 Tax=Smittium culicis TaxID=133412 RepID=A0A1R1Y3Y8_9FUNG|nr:hypothetical protein AYI70_g3324 [Smittium culicis]